MSWEWPFQFTCTHFAETFSLPQNFTTVYFIKYSRKVQNIYCSRAITKKIQLENVVLYEYPITYALFEEIPYALRMRCILHRLTWRKPRRLLHWKNSCQWRCQGQRNSIWFFCSFLSSEMEFTEIILAKVSKLCQLPSHSRDFFLGYRV